MSRFQDPFYLATNQYRDPDDLNARAQLHEHYSTNPYGWFRWVLDQIELPSEAQFLGVGCGSGRLWSTNLARFPSSWWVICSDFSPGMVSACRGRLAEALDQFRFTISDDHTQTGSGR